jgi:hypothetical protein
VLDIGPADHRAGAWDTKWGREALAKQRNEATNPELPADRCLTGSALELKTESVKEDVLCVAPDGRALSREPDNSAHTDSQGRADYLRKLIILLLTEALNYKLTIS